LLDLDDELNTFDLLREHTSGERLYLVDRRRWLVNAKKQVCDADDEGCEWLEAVGD
jgi:hypothetical protein